MHETITTYFAGEKSAGLVLAAIGTAMAAGALVFFRTGGQLRPLAVTLGLWALLELAIGVGLYLKTPAQVAALAKQLSEEPSAFCAAEAPRMLKVQRNFVVIESVWLVLVVSTAALAVWRKDYPMASGVALGILVNASLFLAFDILAERRGSVYFKALSEHCGGVL